MKKVEEANIEKQRKNPLTTTEKKMKIDADIQVDAKVSKTLPVFSFRGLLKKDEQEETILTMSGQKDFPAAFMGKILLDLDDTAIQFVIETGAPAKLSRRLEIKTPTDDLWNVNPSYDAWNVDGTMQKIDGRLQFDVLVENDQKIGDAAYGIKHFRQVLKHTTTIHERLDENKDHDSRSATSYPFIRVIEGTCWFNFLMENKTLVKGCETWTWTMGVGQFFEGIIRKEPAFVHHEIKVDVDGTRIKMNAKNRKETRGEKRGAEGEEEEEEEEGEEEAAHVGPAGTTAVDVA